MEKNVFSALSSEILIFSLKLNSREHYGVFFLGGMGKVGILETLFRSDSKELDISSYNRHFEPGTVC